MSLLIEFKNVTKTYISGETSFNALSNMSFSIKRGEFTGFTGPSGSGKTTVLNLAGGLDAPTNGAVHVNSVHLESLTENQLADYRNASVGFIFQAYNLLPVYSAYENVEFPLLIFNKKNILNKKNRKKEIHEKVCNILELVGLKDKMNKRPAALSGGECQRVAIARAMVKNPDIILADEPTANLDSDNSHAILKIMKELNQKFSTTFVFSTHDEKVMKYLERRIILCDGKIVDDH
jgi:putative ABC transport system ATP-binding protein